MITVEEMRAAMRHEAPDVIARYIAEFDTDNDGTINYEVRDERATCVTSCQRSTRAPTLCVAHPP